jgi:tyrosyl-DNA phosphodiesterase 1
MYCSINYLPEDKSKELTKELKPYIDRIIDRITRINFSSIKVFLITSIPGTHSGNTFGHLRLKSLLKANMKNIKNTQRTNYIICQSSKLGKLGKTSDAYFTSEILESFSQGNKFLNKPEIKLIYPSQEDVANAYKGFVQEKYIHYKSWMNQYLNHWRSDQLNSTKAMPHIKSYCRYSGDGLYWFFFRRITCQRPVGVQRRQIRGSTSILLRSALFFFHVTFLREKVLFL